MDVSWLNCWLKLPSHYHHVLVLWTLFSLFYFWVLPDVHSFNFYLIHTYFYHTSLISSFLSNWSQLHVFFFPYLYNLTWFNYSFPQYSNQRYTGLKSATLYYLFVLPAWQNALNYFHFFLFLFPLYSVAESYLRKFMIYWTLSRRCHLESSKWIPIFKLFPLTYV